MNNFEPQDYIVFTNSLIAELKNSQSLDIYAKRLADDFESAGTSVELVFRIRFSIARMLALETCMPQRIEEDARRLFKVLDNIAEKQ